MQSDIRATELYATAALSSTACARGAWAVLLVTRLLPTRVRGDRPAGRLKQCGPHRQNPVRVPVAESLVRWQVFVLVGPPAGQGSI
jgi:hypothetical protein